MTLYRETLFARALERLVARGGFAAAYLVSREGLVWAKTAAAERQEDFAALTAAAASFYERAAAAGAGPVSDLVVYGAAGGTVTFFRFRYAGEAEGELFIAAVSDGAPGDMAAIRAAAAEITGDLETFY